MGLLSVPGNPQVVLPPSSDVSEKDTTVALDAASMPVSAQESQQLAGTIGWIKDRYQRSLTARRPNENRWLDAWRNFRGLYGPEVAFSENEKSRAFIKITKTKVLAAFSQVIDVLLANNSFPIGIEPKKLPEGIPVEVHVETDPQVKAATESLYSGAESPFGYPGDNKDFPPGATLDQLLDKETKQKTAPFGPVRPGPAPTPSAVTIEPALLCAKKMEKKIQDQLESSSGSKHLRMTAFEMVLFGTGAMKGPLALYKEYPKWDEKTGQYNPTRKLIPTVEATSIWNLYPDPDAFNTDQLSYMIERHRMNRSQMRALKKRPYFIGEAIERAISQGYNYNRLWWEPIISDMPMVPAVERYEVLEYWGMMDRAIAAAQGLEIPEEFKDQDEVSVNCWICGNEVLRLVINPFTPKRIPYHMVPYELQPYLIWGVGLAENMSDTQLLMNGFMRMAVDNGVLSGSLVFEIDETLLVPGQDMTLYPGKIFKKNGGQPGQTIYSHTFPNVVADNLKMFDKARELADEATGVPSITHGNAGIGPNLGRTSSGISMVMGAAAGNIRTVIKNLDDYLLQPLGEAMFAFNMQFDFDPDIKGDIEVVARGTDSLMRNEVRSQRLTQFLQVVSNPMLAPYAKFPYLLREISQSMDLDPDKTTNTSLEAMAQAQILKIMMQGMQGSGNGNPAPSGNDPNGNGNGTIGTGGAPGPAEEGHSNPNQEPGQGQ